MIAAWMLYCALCALGLSLAAVLAERALLAARGPVRYVWVAAVLLSFVVPAAAYRFAAPPEVNDDTAVVQQELAPDSVAGVPAAAPSSAALPAPPSSRPRAAARSDWRAIFARADEPLAMLWLVLSMALSGYFLAGMMALAWLRRGWERHTVLGVPVLVSEQMGPALVAGLSPAIVLPRWALAMESSRLALMLRHEQEHERARDGQLLFAAQLALVAMPWNAALWWQLARLRVAVELDCDARVLRDTDPRAYGDLLLEVVRPGRRSRFMVATAFAERASQLERRIRVMARRRDRASRGMRVLAATVALAAVTAAWMSPRPAGPAHVVTRTAAPIDVARDTATTVTPIVSAIADTTPVKVAAHAPPVAPPPPAAKRPEVVTPSVEVRDSAVVVRPDTNPPQGRGGRGGGPGAGRDPAQVAESVFRRLFEGITLTREQESAARALLTQLARDERAQADSALPAILDFTSRRLIAQTRRDSALRAILTNDADRATLASRLAPPVGGGRRGGAPDSSAGQPFGGRSGGRGGGRGLDPNVVPSLDALLLQMVDQSFHRYFDGLTLTADQEAAARAVLTGAQSELNAIRLPPPRPPILRERLAIGPAEASGLVVNIGAQGEASLLALIGNDADRAKVQARMFVGRQAPLVPRPQP